MNKPATVFYAVDCTTVVMLSHENASRYKQCYGRDGKESGCTKNTISTVLLSEWVSVSVRRKSTSHIKNIKCGTRLLKYKLEESPGCRSETPCLTSLVSASLHFALLPFPTSRLLFRPPPKITLRKLIHFGVNLLVRNRDKVLLKAKTSL
jgi:hypothetical protein